MSVTSQGQIVMFGFLVYFLIIKCKDDPRNYHVVDLAADYLNGVIFHTVKARHVMKWINVN